MVRCQIDGEPLKNPTEDWKEQKNRLYQLLSPDLKESTALAFLIPSCKARHLE